MNVGFFDGGSVKPFLEGRPPRRPRPARRRALQVCTAISIAAWIRLSSFAAENAAPAISVRRSSDGRLAYATDAAGNRVIDFSSAGYHGGGVAIPRAPVKIVVAPEGASDG